MHGIVVAFVVVVLVWLAAILLLVLFGKPAHARALVTLLPDLIRLFRGLASDPRVPRRSKWLLAVAVAWFVSPIDLIPEFIPVLGPLDDAIVAAIVLRHLVKKAGPDVVRDHWTGPDESLRVILRLAGIDR